MSPKTRAIVYPALLLILFTALWQYAASHLRIAFWILPGPGKVLAVFFQKSDLLLYHLRFTLSATLSGFGVSIILGMLTAVLMDAFRGLKLSLYPYMVISQTVPVIAVAPLLILWFGYGISSKIFTVILTCFFPIALNFYDGLSGVNVEQIRLLRSMGASSWKVFRYLKLPSAMPNLFTGLKLSATYSVMGAIIGEWLGGNGGLGIYMTRATKSFDTQDVFAIILLIIILSMSLFLIVSVAERILLRWKYQKIEEYEEV